MKSKVLESDIQKSILEYLTMRGHFVWRNNSGAMFGEHKGKRWAVRFGFKGSSDILGVRKGAQGQMIAIEVKRPGNRATDDQATFLCKIQDMGGLAFVAWDVEDCVKRGL